MSLARIEEIQAELIMCYTLRMDMKNLPDEDKLRFQAELIESKLSPEVEIKHITPLFDIARGRTAHPSVTELVKAWKSEEFLTLFPRKMKVDRFQPRLSGSEEEHRANVAWESCLDTCQNLWPNFKRRESRI